MINFRLYLSNKKRKPAPDRRGSLRLSKGHGPHRKPKSEIVCRCNNVNRETIEAAIRDGADTMNKIFDSTTAGVGPCGGSCRRKLQPLLESFLNTGSFPEGPLEDPRLKDLKKKQG